MPESKTLAQGHMETRPYRCDCLKSTGVVNRLFMHGYVFEIQKIDTSMFLNHISEKFVLIKMVFLLWYVSGIIKI